MVSTRTIFIVTLIAMLLAACNSAAPEPTMDPNAVMTLAFATIEAAGTQTQMALPTSTPTATLAPTDTPEPRPTAFVPTVILPITVLVPVLYCRFGPDTIYVAPYGLRYGKAREAIGRTAAGDWLLVREPGGQKACWVSAANVSVQGDPSTLAVAEVKLPLTSQYPPPPNLKSARSGAQVQIAWDDVPLQKQDIYPNSHFLLEVWTCSGGQLAHNLIGTNDLSITLTDETGCSESSHGQIYTATRAGYSNPEQIPWP